MWQLVPIWRGSSHTSIQHLPYPHGPCQFRGFVRNALPSDHGHGLQTRLAQEGGASDRSFDVPRPNAPGDLDYKVDFVRTLTFTPLPPNHHIGPSDLIHTVFREYPPGYGLLQECHQLIFHEGMSATHQAGEIRKGVVTVALFEDNAFDLSHVVLQPNDLPLSTPLRFCLLGDLLDQLRDLLFSTLLCCC